MPVPALRDVITPTSTANGLPAATLNERFLLTLAMLATGTAPDGTTLPGGGARIVLGPLTLTATGTVSGLPTLFGTATLPLGPLTTTTTGSVPAAGPPVAGYLAWYDASQITGQADNTPLAAWPDLSGNSNNLSQATPANQPTYYSSTRTINGKPVVAYNGTTDVMATAPITVSPGPMSVFVVCQVTDFSNYRGMLTHPTPFDFYFNTVNGIPTFLGGGGSFQGTAAPSTGIAHFVAYTWDGTAGGTGVSHYLDGAANGTGGVSIGVGSTGPVYLGNRNDSGTPFYGLFAELIYYQTVLTGPQITSTYNYLKTKWGTP